MYENLQEVLSDFGADIDFDNPKPGQRGWYTADFIDPEQGKVGTVTGDYRLVFERASDGMPMVYLTEILRLKDGEVRVEAWAEFPSLSSGAWLYCPAVGISGAYLGRHGFRQWRPVELGKTAEAKIVFYTSPTS
ncbi:hypothetical protein OG806_00660 [Streptomyces sp. NBC_00882]|uniref:allene oxide cyclase barrel-like domain-containing protein n=1 Tax=Streptomyces TaxID=1883 RepID=UPI003867888E|nr:hypothetical protein OG806_00660 [Streptomyces sp. NBC_00882]WSZ55104.1 hypothetical protein OH824_00255 [Streptomyces canus]